MSQTCRVSRTLTQTLHSLQPYIVCRAAGSNKATNVSRGCDFTDTHFRSPRARRTCMLFRLQQCFLSHIPHSLLITYRIEIPLPRLYSPCLVFAGVSSLISPSLAASQTTPEWRVVSGRHLCEAFLVNGPSVLLVII